MAVRIQFRRGTASQWATANPVLSPGELGYTTDTKEIKFGSTENLAWNDLPVAAAGDIMAVTVEPNSGLKYVQTASTSAGSGTTNFGTSEAGKSGSVQLAIDESFVITTSAMNNKGDLLVGAADNQYTVLGAGNNGQTLVVNSSAPGGLSWGTPTDPVISNGYITNSMLAADSVTSAKITNLNVTNAKIADGAVTNAKLSTNAVATANVTDLNITSGKIADNAITTTKINNLAVTTDKIAASAVDATKVGTNVYQRATSGSSARIFIQSTTPTGTAGDIWFKF